MGAYMYAISAINNKKKINRIEYIYDNFVTLLATKKNVFASAIVHIRFRNFSRSEM